MLTTLVYLVLYLIVVGLICGLLLWLIDAVGVPQPFHKFARIAVIVIGVLIVIFILLGMVEGTSVPKLKLG